MKIFISPDTLDLLGNIEHSKRVHEELEEVADNVDAADYVNGILTVNYKDLGYLQFEVKELVVNTEAIWLLDLIGGAS